MKNFLRETGKKREIKTGKITRKKREILSDPAGELKALVGFSFLRPPPSRLGRLSWKQGGLHPLRAVVRARKRVWNSTACACGGMSVDGGEQSAGL